jgi:hypothetical protein
MAIDPIVFSKPRYKDSSSVSNYIGGKVNYTNYLNTYEILDNSFYAKGYIFQTFTEKYFNTSYGAFGYYGKVGIFENEYTDYKNYMGGGVSADIQITIPISNVTFKPYGLKATILYEDGEYFKAKLDQFSSLAFTPDRIMTNISQTTGLYYNFKEYSIGTDLSIGYCTTFPHFLMDFTYSANFIYNAPKFSVYVQKAGALAASNDEISVGCNIKLR